MRDRFLACVLLLLSSVAPAGAAAPARRRATAHHKSHQKLVHQAGWAGAGFAAGQVAGPIGGAAVGAAKYRKDIKAGGKRRTHAAVKIGAPIAATAIAGPVGTVGYGAYESRHFIAKHLVKHPPGSGTRRVQSHRPARRVVHRPAAHARSTLRRTR